MTDVLSLYLTGQKTSRLFFSRFEDIFLLMFSQNLTEVASNLTNVRKKCYRSVFDFVIIQRRGAATTLYCALDILCFIIIVPKSFFGSIDEAHFSRLLKYQPKRYRLPLTLNTVEISRPCSQCQLLLVISVYSKAGVFPSDAECK